MGGFLFFGLFTPVIIPVYAPRRQENSPNYRYDDG